MATTKSVRMTRPGTNLERDSDRRIEAAVKQLSSHDRGRKVLSHFRSFCEESGATGLDLSSMSNLICLFKEFSFGQRRDFIARLPKLPTFADVEAVGIEFGYKCCEKGMNLEATIAYARELHRGK
jgi:hypothetical protein